MQWALSAFQYAQIQEMGREEVREDEGRNEQGEKEGLRLSLQYNWKTILQSFLWIALDYITPCSAQAPP